MAVQYNRLRRLVAALAEIDDKDFNLNKFPGQHNLTDCRCAVGHAMILPEFEFDRLESNISHELSNYETAVRGLFGFQLSEAKLLFGRAGESAYDDQELFGEASNRAAAGAGGKAIFLNRVERYLADQGQTSVRWMVRAEYQTNYPAYVFLAKDSFGRRRGEAHSVYYWSNNMSIAGDLSFETPAEAIKAYKRLGPKLKAQVHSVKAVPFEDGKQIVYVPKRPAHA